MKFRPSILSLAALAAVLASCSSDDSPPTAPPPAPNENFASDSLNTTAPTNLFVRTFTNAGDWGYRCTLHPGMDGAVRVSAAGVDSPTVTITNNVFTPNTVNVKTGSYVKWVNAQGVHNVTRP